MRYCAAMLASCLVLIYSSAIAQKTERGFFVAKLGADTIAVESYELTGSTIRGASVARAPQTTYRTYTLTANKNGDLENLELTFGPVGGEPKTKREVRFTDDSLLVAVTQDGSRKESVVKITDRPYPFVADIFGPWYFAVRNALAHKGARTFSILAGTRNLKYDVGGTTPGTLELANPAFGPIFATLDADGRLEKFDMTRTTDKFVVVRAKALDVEAIGREYAARDKSGPLGVLSPRDTVHASINGATVLIDYGRPSMRGRKIFGNIVPWNVVWRLGANAATQLITDKSLVFGTTVVEPGTYSLFALPSEGEWKLIINRQHGQWGTVYDESKDLVRLPLKTERLSQSVEHFGFHMDTKGKQGILSFEWERTKAYIPFEVR